MSATEIKDLVKRLEDLYTHLATNRRHLHTIEDRAENLKNDILALVPPEEEPHEEVVEEAPEEPSVPEELDDAEVAEEEEE